MTRSLIGFLVLFLAVPAFAQNATPAQLRIIVVDETGAGIPAATVTVTQGTGAPVVVMSDERGVAAVPALAQGDAQVHVEFPGFDPADQAVRLRRGANNQTITLKVAGLQTEIVVSDTASTDDRSGNSLTTTLEEEAIEQLPDDPEELQAVLEQMTGGAGATFEVNGFRGGRLPSRDEIRQIRFRTNSFSADNHDAGRVRVEIITRPNVREWSGNANLGLRTDVLNARNAFARAETPEQFRRFNGGLRGPIIPGKTSIRFNVDGNRSYESPPIYALNPDGSIFSSQVRRPRESTNFAVGIEHGLTDNQTLRLEYRREEDAQHNVGVGDQTLPERASERRSNEHRVRMQVQGLVGGTMLHEIRFEFDQQHDEAFSLSSAPTINVSDAFNIGGAGVNSRGTDREFELADNLDFQPSRNHAMRVGILLEGGQYDNFDARNAAGTFTFATRQDYLAGRPLTFTQRLGEVDTSFFHYQLGMYWQDDVRVNSWLSYSLGLRQEMQSHIDDKLNLMPRLGFTLTPNDGKTTIRGGYGLFHDWYGSSLYDQTLRVNGVDQIDLLVLNPGYPDPFSGAVADILPGGRVQASPDLKMPYVHQASIGIEQPITDNLQLQVSYQMLRGRNQIRSRDINAPDENGIRPNPDIGTITQYESTGRSATDRLTFSANYRVPERRLFMGANYTLGSAKNHADSALQLPTDSLNPDVDWGPSSQDVRHRLNAMINLPLPADVQMSVRANAQSASPYTITTGRDDNRDGVTNDRPEGVGRNTERGEARWDLSLRVSKSLGFGGPRTGAGGGGGFRGGRPGVAQQRGPRGGGRGGFFGGRDQRFSVELYAQANNVLNRTNYLNFSGNRLSPFFGKPTSASQARRVELGMQFRF